jgi:polynucleotide 5'-hydroxyl-kinase GRC3/NOL9
LSIDCPSSWRRTIDEVAGAGGVCVLLGAVDTGKSTFCALLASTAARAGRRAAVVDADVGQSDIGPPACVGMGLVARPVERLSEVAVSALYFVGSTSPAGHLLPAVVGARLAVDAALRAGADLVMVDTTGMIHGAAARALKLHKLDALRPAHMIALQRGGEAEHLLAPYEHAQRPRVHRLLVSPRVQARSRDQRLVAREAAYRRYFGSAADIEIALDAVAIQGSAWRSGRPLPGHLARHLADALGGEVVWAERGEQGIFAVAGDRCGPADRAALARAFPEDEVRVARAQDFEGLLVGVIDGQGETLGMGILTGIDFGSGRARLHSPVRERERIVALRPGSLRLARDYSELACNRPGATG